VISGKNQQFWLYNLQQDKAEKTDVASQNPAKVKELSIALENWEKGLKKPLWLQFNEL
jgi:hypothetical protein